MSEQADHVAICGPSQLVKIDDGKSVHVRTAAEWLELARRDLERRAYVDDGQDAKRLDWLHRELKVMIAYSLCWPTIPQDLVSWRATLDKSMEAAASSISPEPSKENP